MIFADGDPRSLLEQLSPDSFAQGIVNIIDLGAIRAHAPDHWERRSEQVEDHVQRAFRKRARVSDILIRLSDTQFVAIQPEGTRAVAIACCGHVARETLSYFIGAEVTAPISLQMATGFGPRGVAAVAIEPAEIADAMAGVAAGVAERRPLLSSAWTLIPSTARAPRVILQVNPNIEAMLRLEPIWHSFHGAVASFLIHPTILREGVDAIVPLKLTELGPRLAGILTAQMIDFSIALLHEGEREGRRFGLHLPMPLDALTLSRERLLVRNHCQPLAGALAQRVVIELCDCADGLPQSRMAELVSLVKPYCRAVIARIDGEAPPMLRWREAGLAGVAIVFDGASDRSNQLEVKRLKALAEIAVAPRTLIVAHGLRKRELALAAWAGGFTHVSGQVISEVTTADAQSVRLSASEIFAV